MPAIWGDITAGEILSAIGGEWISGTAHAQVAGLSIDTRTLEPGELFLALRGEQFDGHDFAGNALERGAVGIAVHKDWWKARRQDRDSGIFSSEAQDPVVIAVDDTLKALGDLAGWWRRQHDVQVAAITGSAGKTTTKEMAGTILMLGGGVLKNQGNLNNLIGLPMTLIALKARHRKAVLEMGMNRPGEIGRLTEIAAPDVGVITNIGRAHLEGVGNLEGVAKAKWELVEKISPGGKIVLNGDDEVLMEMDSAFGKKAVTFGLAERNAVKALHIRTLGRDGTTFDLHYQDTSLPIRLRVPGTQNVYNALAAATVALLLNESPENIINGLRQFSGIEGRFSVFNLPGPILVVNDTYNANPSSLRAAFESVEALMDEGQRIFVGLGEMMELGTHTVEAHREAGRMVARLGAYRFFAIGEHAREMLRGAVEASMPCDRMEEVRTPFEMAEKIAEEADRGDLIFIKGSRKMRLEKAIEALRGSFYKIDKRQNTGALIS